MDEIDDRGTNSYGTSTGDDESYFIWDCGRHRGFLVGARASLCCRGETGTVLNKEILPTVYIIVKKTVN